MDRSELEQRVTQAASEYRIRVVQFRHVVGASLGLNVTDTECLAVLFHRGVATPKELASYTGLSSGATTAMLDRLERSGLVERRPNPKDRRGTLIVVVEEAGRRIAPLLRPAGRGQEEIMAEYTTEELDRIADFLERSAVMWEAERQRLLDASRNRETEREKS